MIDLIIPYYNNRIGLLNTLKSINTNIFEITIVDDHSTETPIIDNSVAQVFRLNINCGPGFARQKGIDKTHNPYIMFIDTGDIFTSVEAQQGILNTITSNPKLDFISFPYYHYGELTKETDNRLHGKIYKRSFLEKYGITFAPESSYLNEDIGFNRTCRLCTNMTFIPMPVIEQIEDNNSLTRKNDQESLYRSQTRALSLVTIHTVDICNKNNIDTTEEINQIAVTLYYFFLRTMAERPIFAIDAWAGARIFYKYFKNDIIPNNLLFGNAKLKQCLQYRNKISFPINILRFVDDILKNEIPPNNYLT